jgi:branched-chain amino acid aminotransferase
MYRVDWSREHGWHQARIEPYAPLALDPAAAVLHYAQAIFEGGKAFRGTDGRIRFFRLMDHCRRFEHSAAGLAMPGVPADEMAQAIMELVRVDEAWVPKGRGTALYLRPTLIATEAFLGVRAAERYTAFIIMSPVGAYWGGDGVRAIRLWLEEQRVRAAKGGIGWVKAAANYAASMPAALEAKKRGYDQVLWTDAAEHSEIEEAGTMNVFVRIGDTVITPPLDGTILPGMTRQSALQLLRDWGIPVEERPITVAELRAAGAAGTLKEVWGAGTAAVISPVSTLGTAQGEITVGDGQPGEIARRLLAAITAIQYGEAEDRHGWMTEL